MAQTVETVPGKWRPIPATKQILSPTVSTFVTLSAPYGASFCYLMSISANVKWWDDGSTPTVSQGFTLAAGTLLEYRGDLSAWKGIAESGTPSLNVTYYTNNPPNAT